MNERIQELAKQARKNSVRWGVYTEEEFYEKFAELMIKECIQVLETNNANLTLDSKWEAIYEIETHFGVKK
jgi:hypothetical protein